MKIAEARRVLHGMESKAVAARRAVRHLEGNELSEGIFADIAVECTRADVALAEAEELG